MVSQGDTLALRNDREPSLESSVTSPDVVLTRTKRLQDPPSLSQLLHHKLSRAAYCMRSYRLRARAAAMHRSDCERSSRGGRQRAKRKSSHQVYLQDPRIESVPAPRKNSFSSEPRSGDRVCRYRREHLREAQKRSAAVCLRTLYRRLFGENDCKSLTKCTLFKRGSLDPGIKYMRVQRVCPAYSDLYPTLRRP